MTTAVATQPDQNREMTIKERLNDPRMIAQLGRAMPAHCKPDRMARVALTALTKNPKLAKCTQASFFECMLNLSQWGLEPDGRRAHLIPYGTTCTLVVDYKGYVELAYRSGVVKNIHADLVREGDIFEYNLGRILKHVPWFLRRDEDKPEAEGEVFAAFCIAELSGDTVKTEVLSKQEVEGIRKRSAAANNGPWKTDWGEMAKKTCFRRLSKWLPLSAEILDAIDADADKAPPLPNQGGSRVRESEWQLPAIQDQEQEQGDDSIPGEASNEVVQPEPADVDVMLKMEANLGGCKTPEQLKAWEDAYFGPDGTLDAGQEEVARKRFAFHRERIAKPGKAKQGGLL